jgi:hypothetical protein
MALAWVWVAFRLTGLRWVVILGFDFLASAAFRAQVGLIITTLVLELINF